MSPWHNSWGLATRVFLKYVQASLQLKRELTYKNMTIGLCIPLLINLFLNKLKDNNPLNFWSSLLRSRIGASNLNMKTRFF